jgi:serine protease AprX
VKTKSMLSKITLAALAVFAAIGTSGLSNIAQAAPYIDPALRPLLRSESQNDSHVVRVIVHFNDKMPLPNLPHSAAFHEQMERAMMQNAAASQATFLAQLTQMDTMTHTMGGAPSRIVSKFWIFNAMAVDMPVSILQQVSRSEDLKAIYASKQFHIIRDAPRSTSLDASTVKAAYAWGIEKIGMKNVNAQFPNATGEGVRVGILDTGIDATHPDLAGRLLVFKDFVTGSATPVDDHGHGTHVSGTISGGDTSGTQIGIAPKVKLIVGKIFDSSGASSTETIMQGMQWMADPDGNPSTNDFPNLVSNSWGGAGPEATENPADDNFCQAVDVWVKLGMLPVFAAGNSGPDASSVGLPGACPNAIAVGATDSNDQIADFSSRGPVVWKSGSIIKPNVSAPGVKILSSLPGDKYDSWDGTSMATPHVSGLAALLYQAQPNATVEQMTARISSTAVHLGNAGMNNDYGMGRIDAMKALSAGQ